VPSAASTLIERSKLAGMNIQDVTEEDLEFFKNLTYLDISDIRVHMHQLINLVALRVSSTFSTTPWTSSTFRWGASPACTPCIFLSIRFHRVICETWACFQSS